MLFSCSCTNVIKDTLDLSGRPYIPTLESDRKTMYLFGDTARFAVSMCVNHGPVWGGHLPSVSSAVEVILVSGFDFDRALRATSVV